MSFTVFPDASIGPLTLGPGQISAPLAFTPPEGPAVFLRIVMLGDECKPPGAPDPTFQLRAGQGPSQDLPYDDPHVEWVFVYDRPEPAGDFVAKAKVFREPANVYAIKILLRRRGSMWQLRITNHADAERKFRWVVADNKEDSAQPWMNLPQMLSFDGKVSKDVTRSLDVCNLGTGPLTMSLGGLTTGSKFQLEDRPVGVAPNDSKKLIITFHAPTSAGTTEELYTAISDDQHATDSAHHNNRIRLIARTTPSDPDPPPPPPGLCIRCRTSAGPERCTSFLGVASSPASLCQRDFCRHPAREHE